MILKVVSPEKVIFSGDVQMVKLPGSMGQFTVLENHAPLVSVLIPGQIIYRTDEEHTIEIRGGIVEVLNNNVAVCIN